MEAFRADILSKAGIGRFSAVLQSGLKDLIPASRPLSKKEKQMSTPKIDQPDTDIERAVQIQTELSQPELQAAVADDPIHLSVGAVTDPLLKWDFFQPTIGIPGRRRTPFVGFSFFGEVGGFKPQPGDTGFIHLKDSRDTINPPSTPPNIVKTFGEWLNDLSTRRINYSRIFAFANPPNRTAYYPYSVVGGQTTEFDLRAMGQRYFDRLNEYIAFAKTSNIVVCISLFSDHALRVGAGAGFESNPFNKDKNKPEYDFIASTTTAAVRQTFYNIAAPPNGWQNLHNPAVWAGWSLPQKLYAVQRFLVTEIVNRTKRHWNVMYEIGNEPVPVAGELDEKWNFEVASWVDALLWDSASNGRKRLVQCNLGPDPLADRVATLKKLLAGGPHPLIDAFAFHGSEWAGTSTSEPSIQATIRTAVNGLYNLAITPTRKLSSYPVALIFDSDASPTAQANPYQFCHATLGIQGSFNQRGKGSLTPQLDALNKVRGPANFVCEMDLGLQELSFFWEVVPQATGYRLTFQPSSPGGFTPPPVTLGPGASDYSIAYTNPFAFGKTTIVALFGAIQTYPTLVAQLRPISSPVK